MTKMTNSELGLTLKNLNDQVADLANELEDAARVRFTSPEYDREYDIVLDAIRAAVSNMDKAMHAISYAVSSIEREEYRKSCCRTEEKQSCQTL